MSMLGFEVLAYCFNGEVFVTVVLFYFEPPEEPLKTDRFIKFDY